MRRRALLATLAAATAGCTDGPGDGGTPEPTPEQDTLAPETDATATDTATPGGATDTDGSTPSDTPTATPERVRFDAEIEQITECGFTCRTLTYTIQNHGAGTAAGVEVGIRVFTGGEQVYEDSQTVGDIDARSQRTGVSKDVDPGLGAGRKIKSNDGQVVVELTPRAEGGAAATFSFDRQLDV